jgi:hypothetical protein
MNKELVKIEELTGESWIYQSDWTNCKLVQETILSYDLDLRTVSKEVVVRRLSDNKLFMFWYEEGYEQPFYKENIMAQEVKEETINTIITIYV